MGKKTWETFATALLISFISILSTTIVVKRRMLDNKLDKVDYYRDQEHHEKRHDREREDIKEVKEMVKYLYEKEMEKGD